MINGFLRVKINEVLSENVKIATEDTRNLVKTIKHTFVYSQTLITHVSKENISGRLDRIPKPHIRDIHRESGFLPAVCGNPSVYFEF